MNEKLSLSEFGKVNNLIDLFENVKIDDVLSFLQETGGKFFD